MAASGSLLRHLRELEHSASAGRRLARERRRRERGGEILTTYLAYPLKDAAERMALGMVIGDSVTLRHSPDPDHDLNAVRVFWNDTWVGFVPRNLAAVLVPEMPELGEGVEAVITELTTTTRRDAFRVQLSVPIEHASEKIRALAVNARFSWDFDQHLGTDKLRLVMRCSERDFRDLQNLLGSHYGLSKWGYSYYPLPDGRYFPWYCSLEAAGDGPAPEPETIEGLVRETFGMASESRQLEERNLRFEEQGEELELIRDRLSESQAVESRLQRELESSRRRQQKRTAAAEAQREEAVELASSVDLDLSIARQELDLALQENKSIGLECQRLDAQVAQLKGALDYYIERASAESDGAFEASPVLPATENETEPLQQRMHRVLRDQAATMPPLAILELVETIFPESLDVLPSARRSAEQAKGFELGERLFDLLWKLATTYRSKRLGGAPDAVGIEVFGHSVFALSESESTTQNERAQRERRFLYQGEEVLMLQHLKIGTKDSANRTLRVHFLWDPALRKVVIGHFGRHLHNPRH